MVGREPRRAGEVSYMWVVGMQWWVKMSKNRGSKPEEEQQVQG
jgi:hypothetical protein